MVNLGHKQALHRSKSSFARRMAVALLVALMVGLIAYKIGSALRVVQTARLTGVLNLHPYLASQRGPVTLVAIWMKSLAYLRIIWPALVFGILIAAGAHIAIPPDWIALNFNRSKAYSTFAGAAAGVPLMLCSCCVAPVFEGVYARTRRLDTSIPRADARGASSKSHGADANFYAFPYCYSNRASDTCGGSAHWGRKHSDAHFCAVGRSRRPASPRSVRVFSDCLSPLCDRGAWENEHNLVRQSSLTRTSMLLRDRLEWRDGRGPRTRSER